MNVRTDLALEANELYRESDSHTQNDGIRIEEESADSVHITRVHIVNEQGEEALSKPRGSYITLEIPDIFHQDFDIDTISNRLSYELKKICPLDENSTVLVIGLGNRMITADALGPKVTENLLITRHLFSLMPEHLKKDTRSVSAVSPGVLGVTGIETNEIVKGVVENTKPDLIIAIDSLASRRLSRVVTTIQLANTGITPGAGLGNNRKSISLESLGVPVIAIGVPTVVDAVTVANDTIDLLIDNLIHSSPENSSFYKFLKSMDKNEKYEIIKQVLSVSDNNMVVTPKDMDEIIDKLSKIISGGINLALNNSNTLESLLS